MAGSFVVAGSLERETEVVQEERVVRMLADRLLVDLDGFREGVPLVGGIAQTEERLCIGGIDRMRAPPCSSAWPGAARRRGHARPGCGTAMIGPLRDGAI